MLELVNDPPLWLALKILGLSAVITAWSIWRETAVERVLIRSRTS